MGLKPEPRRSVLYHKVMGVGGFFAFFVHYFSHKYMNRLEKSRDFIRISAFASLSLFSPPIMADHGRVGSGEVMIVAHRLSLCCVYLLRRSSSWVCRLPPSVSAFASLSLFLAASLLAALWSAHMACLNYARQLQYEYPVLMAPQLRPRSRLRAVCASRGYGSKGRSARVPALREVRNYYWRLSVQFGL
jgi:hypothetical protein